MAEWLLDGPEGQQTVTAATQDEAVEKYGLWNSLEDYELSQVRIVSVTVPA